MDLVHPDRVLWTAPPITRGELLAYWARVLDRFLLHARGRPLTLVRCPKGVGESCQFMRHSRVWAPRPIRTIQIAERTKVGEYMVIDDLSSLLALVQMDVIEVHTWNTREDAVEIPDRVVLDLDPGPEVAFDAVIAAARRLREILAAIGLDSWPKTTGGRGLHVVVPLVPALDWKACLVFSRAIAQLMTQEDPTRYTTRVPKAGRERKILLDYLRNNRTNTSVAALSPRARPGAPVSWPLSWDDVGPGLDPSVFTLATPLPRRDPWAGYFRSTQRLRPDLAAALR